MIRKSTLSSAVLVLGTQLVLCISMQAQNGCVNSPENSTAVLAVVGAAGMFFARIRNRR